jgi:hypothetical protein
MGAKKKSGKVLATTKKPVMKGKKLPAKKGTVSAAC